MRSQYLDLQHKGAPPPLWPLAKFTPGIFSNSRKWVPFAPWPQPASNGAKGLLLLRPSASQPVPHHNPIMQILRMGFFCFKISPPEATAFEKRRGAGL